MTATNIGGDLNDIIVSAVNARVEAAVAEALAGDDLFKTYIQTALQAPVEVRKPSGYGNVTVTFMTNAISIAIQEATKIAVRAWLASHTDMLTNLIANEMQSAAPSIAKHMVGKLSEKADSPYGITVELRYPER